jgi:hypothetical protein
MGGARETINRAVMFDRECLAALHRHAVALEIADRIISADRDMAALDPDIDRRGIGLRRKGGRRQCQRNDRKQCEQGLVFHDKSPSRREQPDAAPPVAPCSGANAVRLPRGSA